MIAGHRERADYMIEAMGCGVAFFDYDNDGWLDILVLTGSRFGDPPADATNRLYKNNRDGTFTDVTEKAGLFRTGWVVRRHRGRLRQRRLRRSVPHLLGPERALPQQRRRHVHRRHQGGRAARTRSRAGAPAALSSTTTATAASTCSSPTTWTSTSTSVPRARRRSQSCNYEGRAGQLRPARSAAGRHSLYHNNGDGTFTDVTRAAGHRQGRRAATA